MIGDAVRVLLPAVHAVPDVYLVNLFLRHVFEVVRALWVEPAFIGAQVLAHLTGHHELLLDLALAHAIEGEVALAHNVVRWLR